MCGINVAGRSAGRRGQARSPHAPRAARLAPSYVPPAFLVTDSFKQCLLGCFSRGLSPDVSLRDLIVVLLPSIIIHDINFLGKEGIRRKLIKTETRSDFSN